MSDQIGIWPGMSRAEYIKIPAMNMSTLLNGEQSMLHLQHAILNPSTKTTDALDFGIAVHLAVFEPSEFPKRVKTPPDVNRKEKKGREEYNAFVANCTAKGITVLSVKDHERCVAVRDAMRAYAPTREIMDSKGVGELAAVWRDKETGLLCKGMLDRLCGWKGWSLVPDLKTIEDASFKSFRKAVVNFNYHVKCAYYMDGLDSIAPSERRFFWIAVEKTPPFAIAIWEPTDDCMREGRKIYRKLLSQYDECRKTGIWPGYSPIPEPLPLPSWAKERIEFE